MEPFCIILIVNAPICFCDEDCIYYKDCCDDYGKPLMMTGLRKTDKQRRHRMSTSFCDLIPEDSKFGVKVISACNTDGTLNCSKTDDNSELIDMVYVTGSDGLTYKNRHCALCNGITSFQLWSLQFQFSRSAVRSLGKYSCEGSVFDNVTKLSQFEMASYLKKICSYRFIPPSGAKPRLCVGERHTCNAFFWSDENPFQILKSSDALGMMALFMFDDRPKDSSDKVSGESTQYSTDLILSNRVLTHRLWFEGDRHLTLDQLHKLVESMYIFLNTAVSDLIFTEPFIVDFILVDVKEVRLQIFIIGESIYFVKLSRYTIVKEWLNYVIIEYHDTDVYSNQSYNVVSSFPWEQLASDNKSYEVVRMRYYSDHYIIDYGAKFFGKEFTRYEEYHPKKVKITFPSSMCKKVNILFTSYFNETSSETICVSNETTEHSNSNHLYPSVIGLYLMVILLMMY